MDRFSCPSPALSKTCIHYPCYILHSTSTYRSQSLCEIMQVFEVSIIDETTCRPKRHEKMEKGITTNNSWYHNFQREMENEEERRRTKKKESPRACMLSLKPFGHADGYASLILSQSLSCVHLFQSAGQIGAKGANRLLPMPPSQRH